MKKHLILYIFILTSSTKLMASSVYLQLGISSQAFQIMPVANKEKRKTLKLDKSKRKQVNSFSKILKYVKTKKISEEKSKVGAKINYIISETVQLELDLSTTLYTKDLTRINTKGREAHFTFSFLL